jgi:hypothetical protein
MPLPKNSVTASEFTSLMNFIDLQKLGFEDAEGWAESGLQFVVLMQRTTPEVDLIQPHATHFLNLESLNSSSPWTNVVSSINDHVARRGTTANAAETVSDRLNRWLWCQGVKVTSVYSGLSFDAGWQIDPCNVRGDDADPDSQLGEFILDDEGNVIGVGCTDSSIYQDPPAAGIGCPTTGGDEIGQVGP